MYSNGLSEVMLGRSIKDLQLPREELVILTKVGTPTEAFLLVTPFGLSPLRYTVQSRPHTASISMARTLKMLAISTSMASAARYVFPLLVNT